MEGIPGKQRHQKGRVIFIQLFTYFLLSNFSMGTYSYYLLFEEMSNNKPSKHIRRPIYVYFSYGTYIQIVFHS